ncbi:glycosyltransferase family 4 protein [Vibrio sp. FNV 38]|nr:glycosyltransferase family 4 protein [Vibrio sp. FNV 38]
MCNVDIHQGEVWIFLDSLTFGGIETHVVELARGLKQCHQPVRVILLTKFTTVSAIITKLTQSDIPFNYLYELTNALPSQRFLDLLRQCKAACTLHHPSVLHAHGYKASLVSKLASGRTKQITTFHSGETPAGLIRVYDLLDRYSAFLSHTSFVVSDKIANKIPFQTQKLNNFIDTQSLISCSGKEVAFVGRLSHEKGPDRFIQIAGLLPDYQFSIYGDGELTGSLKAIASGNVHFHGFQSDMPSVWESIGVLLITSRYEGLPMTALEAMARGIPVISTNVGAIESLIQNENNGWVVEQTIQFPALIEQWFSADDNYRQNIRLNAKNTVNTYFSSQSVIPQIIEYYKQ